MNGRLSLLAFAFLSFSAMAETTLPSVQQVQDSLRVAEGLTVELVASEPQISSPVAMAFDENGVLYVVEMLDYPTAAKDKPPLGRIKRLDVANQTMSRQDQQGRILGINEGHHPFVKALGRRRSPAARLAFLHEIQCRLKTVMTVGD